MIRVVVQAGNTNVQRDFRRFFPKLKKICRVLGILHFLTVKTKKNELPRKEVRLL